MTKAFFYIMMLSLLFMLTLLSGCANITTVGLVGQAALSPYSKRYNPHPKLFCATDKWHKIHCKYQ